MHNEQCYKLLLTKQSLIAEQFILSLAAQRGSQEWLTLLCSTFFWVILKYAGTMAPMAPILLLVGGAKAEL